MILADSAVAELKRLAEEYLEKTRPYFPAPDAWKKLGRDAAWKRFVYQVAIVGGSSAESRLAGSPDAQRDLSFDHLESLTPEERHATVHRVLRDHGVRYAAKEPERCRKTSAIVRNFGHLSKFEGGPVGYLKSLASMAGDMLRVRRVIQDMAYIEEKGARDLLAEMGLVTDVVAFDTRLIGILNRLGVSTPRNLQTSPRRYAELERELIDRVCVPRHITGVQLDRILYGNYKAISAELPGGTGKHRKRRCRPERPVNV